MPAGAEGYDTHAAVARTVRGVTLGGAGVVLSVWSVGWEFGRRECVVTVWDEVVGQPEAVATLRAAVDAAAAIVGHQNVPPGGMTHAWLFTGPPGSGRSVAARAFASALQCAEGGCGVCAACHTVKAGTHGDLHLVNPEGLSIPVGQMRRIVQTAARAPGLGRWQVVLIEDADRLTEAASNALLKAVEEPPDRTVFLLCAPSTHPDDVSVTIRSRCRVVPLRTPAPEAVAEVLHHRDGIDVETARWAAAASQGHVGRARRLARDEKARDRRDAVLSVPASLRSLKAALSAADALVRAAEEEAAAYSAERDQPERDALATALGAGGEGKGTSASARGSAAALKELERQQKSRATRAQRDALDRALVDLAGFYRDVLIRQAGADVPAAHPDRARDVAKVATMTPEDALARLDAVLACREALELNVKPRIAVEAMTAALALPAAR
ncbi:MAG TPA: DNA polymerase III subunit delta' [Mycobacteriales bacterium]|nr:DNA polymerase III subunit delta' [Mycobacteriales bacterium]